jgi:phage terminase small subunit
MAGMNPRQRLFVREYLIDLDPVAAYARAGYAATGQSAVSAANRLMQHPGVAVAIRQAMAERETRTKVTADRVVDELAKLAFSDLGEVAQWDGTGMRLLPGDQISARARAAIKSVQIERKQIGEDDKSSPVISVKTRIVMHDKKGALDSLARHLGMFIDQTRITIERKVDLDQAEKMSDEQLIAAANAGMLAAASVPRADDAATPGNTTQP